MAGVLSSVPAVTAPATTAPVSASPDSTSTNSSHSLLYLLLLLPKPTGKVGTATSTRSGAISPSNTVPVTGKDVTRDHIFSGISLSVDNDEEIVNDGYINTKKICGYLPLLKSQRQGGTRQLIGQNSNQFIGSDTRAAVAMVESFVDDMVTRPSGDRPGYVMINSRNPVVIQQLVEALTHRFGQSSVIQEQSAIHSHISQAISVTPRPRFAPNYMPVFPYKPHRQSTGKTEMSEIEYIRRQLASIANVTVSTGTLINDTLAGSRGEDDNDTTDLGGTNSEGDEGNNTIYIEDQNKADKKDNISQGDSNGLNISHFTTSTSQSDITTLVGATLDPHDATPLQDKPPDDHPAIQHSEKKIGGGSWKGRIEDIDMHEDVPLTTTFITIQPSTGVYINNVFHPTWSTDVLHKTNEIVNQVEELSRTSQDDDNIGSNVVEYTADLSNPATSTPASQFKQSTTSVSPVNFDIHMHENTHEASYKKYASNNIVPETTSVSTRTQPNPVNSTEVSSYSKTGQNVLPGVPVAETEMAGSYNEDYYEEIDSVVALSPTKFMRRVGLIGVADDVYYEESDAFGTVDSHITGKEPVESSHVESNGPPIYNDEIGPTGGHVTKNKSIGEHVTEDRPIGEHIAESGPLGEHIVENRPVGDHVADDAPITMNEENNEPLGVKEMEEQQAGINVHHRTAPSGENEGGVEEGGGEKEDAQKRKANEDEGEGAKDENSVRGDEGGEVEATAAGTPHRHPHNPAYYRQSGPSFHPIPPNFFPTRPANLPRPTPPRPQLTPEQQALISQLPLGTQHIVSTIVQAMQATPAPPATPAHTPPATPAHAPPAAPAPFLAPFYPAFPPYPYYPPSTYHYPPPPHQSAGVHHTLTHHGTHTSAPHHHGTHHHGAYNLGTHDPVTHNHDTNSHGIHDPVTHSHGTHDHSSHNHGTHDDGIHHQGPQSSPEGESGTTTIPLLTEAATLDPGVGASRLGVAAGLGDVDEARVRENINRQGILAPGASQPDRNQGTLQLRQDLSQMGHGSHAPSRLAQYRPPQQAAMHMGAPVVNVVVPQAAPAPAPPQQEEEGPLTDLLDDNEGEATPVNSDPQSMDREEMNSLLHSLFSSPTLLLLGIVFATSAAYMAITMEEQAAQQRFQQAQLAAAFGSPPFPQPGRRRRNLPWPPASPPWLSLHHLQ